MSWLTDRRIFRRLFVALPTGLLLNLLAWSAGYYLLPEGALRGVPLVSNLPLGEQGGPVGIFVEIFLFNLLVAGGTAALANLFRVGNLPLGYVYAWGNWVLFGLFLGTDSFKIAGRGKLAPSLLRLLQSKGFYEISAYTIIATATAGLFLFRQSSWLDWTTKKVRAWSDLRLKRPEVLALIVAVLLLFGANLWEAAGIARAGAREITAHTLRHTFTNNLADSGYTAGPGGHAVRPWEPRHDTGLSFAYFLCCLRVAPDADSGSSSEVTL